VVAAARAQRDRWVCDRERDSIELARQYWTDLLTQEVARQSLHLPPGGVAPSELLLVQDRAACIRAADAVDRSAGASGLATTVFRYGPYYLVSQPTFGGSHLVLNEGFEVVQNWIVE
jgi:hypothetical protein